MPIERGRPAPDFELRDQHGRPVRLSSFHGRSILLVFFPLAFTPTCTGELHALRDELGDLPADDVQVLAVSCDPSSSLRVFAEQQALTFPLLSDFWPHGEVSRAYGAFLEDRGFPTRATFAIDRAGMVRWSVVTSPGEPRSVDDYRKALAEL